MGNTRLAYTYDARQHFIEERTQTPIIHNKSVRVAQENFGGQVFCSSTKGRSRAIILLVKHFGQTKIGQDDMSIASNQNIFRL